MKLTDLLLNRFLYKEFRQDIETKDSVYDSVNAVPDAVPPVPAGGSAQDINISNVTINPTQLTPGIPLPPGLLDIANWGWGQTCVFSSTDLDTVSWTLGVFKSADGVSYNIIAGNTGNMTAKTYIYLDLLTSTTTYQKTTVPGNTVGVGKVLVAVAENATAGNLATYNLSEATQIVGDNILANSINASKITTGQLIVGTNVGLGTAQDSFGVTTIVGNTVTTGYVNALQVTSKLFKTAASGQRIEIESANTNQIRFYDSSTLFGKLEVYKVGADGYIGLIAQDDGAGFEVYTGIGASAFSSASIFSNGGSFDTNGNASNGYNIITARNGGTFTMHGGPSGDEIDCNIGFNGIYFWENNTAGGNRVKLQAPSSFTADYTFTLPTTGGTSGYVLQTNGSGVTSWVAQTAPTSGANTALSNLASVAINTSLLLATDGAFNLGSNSKTWAALYISANGYIFGGSEILFDCYANDQVRFGSNAGYGEFNPFANVSANLGAPTLRWGTAYVDTLDCNSITNSAGGNDTLALLDSGFGTITLVFSEGVYTGSF